MGAQNFICLQGGWAGRIQGMRLTFWHKALDVVLSHKDRTDMGLLCDMFRKSVVFAPARGVSADDGIGFGAGGFRRWSRHGFRVGG